MEKNTANQKIYEFEGKLYWFVASAPPLKEEHALYWADKQAGNRESKICHQAGVVILESAESGISHYVPHYFFTTHFKLSDYDIVIK